MAQELNVNIIPQSYLPEIRVSENDNTLRIITVNVVNEDGSPYEIPEGATATFAGTKPSGLGFTAECTIEDSAVTFAVSDTMSNEAGRFPAEIRFMDGEDRIGTCNVLMRVEPNPHPDDTTDGDREPLVNEITALLEDITEQAEQVAEDAQAVQNAVTLWTNMTAEAETLPAGSEASASYSEGVLSLGIPAGPEGTPGQDGEDGVGIASIVLNADYTLTITLTDGRTYTTTSIRGEQGETGLTPDFTIGTVTTLEPGSQATATITGTDEAPVLNLGIPKGDTGEVSMEDFLKVAVTDTASGSGVVTIPDGANLPMKSLKVTLEPIQSGSGTPSPDNVRPISGYDEVSANVVGKNMFGGWEVLESCDFNYSDKTIVAYGTSNGRQLLIFEIKPNTAYTLSFPNGRGAIPSSYYPRLSWALLTDEPQIGSVCRVCTYSDGSTAQKFTTGANDKYLAVQIALGGMANTIAVAEYVQLELGSTATDYEPYNTDSASYTADLGQTVYGGTVDLVSGELVIDRAMVDLGTATWYYVSAQDCFYTYKVREYTKQSPNLICSNYPYVGICADLVDKSCGYIYGNAICIRDSSFNQDASAFKTAMNGVQLVYELATPQTIQLTPQEIRAVLGTNNVWGDGSNTYIKYIADTRLYILKVLADA